MSASSTPDDAVPDTSTTRRAIGLGTAAALLGAGVGSLAGSAPAAAPQGVQGLAALRTLDTVADMVASPVGARLVALVLGYSAVNDGGGGVFLWDPSSTSKPDGGTVFASARSERGRWLRLAVA